MTEKLWEPSAERAAGTLLAEFMRETGIGAEGGALDYETLWDHSVRHPQAFWTEVWRFCDVIGDRGPTVLDGGKTAERSAVFS